MSPSEYCARGKGAFGSMMTRAVFWLGLLGAASRPAPGSGSFMAKSAKSVGDGSMAPDPVGRGRAVAPQLSKTDRDVAICRGIGDLSTAQFAELGEVWKRYVNEGVVTATSPLLYRLGDNGTFEAFGSPKDAYEEKTMRYLAPKGAKTLPHVWCDASCCKNCALPDSLTAAMKNKDQFFKQSVDAAKKWGWHGYALDFEGSMPDRESTTQFFQEWRQALAKHTSSFGTPLELHLWTGSGADEAKLAKAPVPLTSAIDMSSYYYSSALLNTSDSAGGGFGASDLYCPPGRGAHTRSSSLLEYQRDRNTRASGASRAGELNAHMKQWCQTVGANCAVGLITYDLSNAGMSCKDVGEVGKGALEANVRQFWIWSGGIVKQEWEPGLRRFIRGTTDNNMEAACTSPNMDLKRLQAGEHLPPFQQATAKIAHADAKIAEAEMKLAEVEGTTPQVSKTAPLVNMISLSTTNGACGCKFDRDFCCNGVGRKEASKV